jgi:DNA polymerase III sliding clamp (beta) subunit (PCNA family)
MQVKFINTTEVKYTQLKSVVSNDDLRPVMCGVYIDFKEKRLVATDAHVLISYPIEITENDSELEGVIVPVEYFNRLRYMIALPTKSKMIIDIEYVLTDTYAEIHWCGEMIYRCKYIEGKYPNWNGPMIMINPDDYPDKPKKIGINAHILKKMLLGIPSANPQTLIMETTSKTHAILFTTENMDYDRPIKAIVMPAMLNTK